MRRRSRTSSLKSRSRSRSNLGTISESECEDSGFEDSGVDDTHQEPINDKPKSPRIKATKERGYLVYKGFKLTEEQVNFLMERFMDEILEYETGYLTPIEDVKKAYAKYFNNHLMPPFSYKLIIKNDKKDQIRKYFVRICKACNSKLVKNCCDKHIDGSRMGKMSFVNIKIKDPNYIN